MLQVTTTLNSLAGESGDKYCFRSSVNQTLTTEQLITEIVNYNSTLTAADVRAVLSVLDIKVRDFVNKGYKVELPFMDVRLKATGTCANKEDSFTAGSGNHVIGIAVTVKESAREEMTANASYSQLYPESPRDPKITLVYSVNADGTKNTDLGFRAGDSVRITGKNLAFDFSDSEQGVFLQSGETCTRVEKYNRLGGSVLDTFIPSGLAAGTYSVFVRTKPGTARYKKAEFEHTVTVV